MLPLVVTFIVLHQCTCTNLIVKTENGELRGSIIKDRDGHDIYSFQKIPFAQPPVGELRFKDPRPVQNWKGVKNATEVAPQCLQTTFFVDEFFGEEDCLYLNIYTPNVKPKNPLPVLVFIHGGGFIEGSGNYNNFGPEFIVPENCILVTLNYRLGILGFTAFENPNVGVSGNAGLKDQTMALRWIKNNIERFGGDPRKITVSGKNAGGGSSHLHVLSPLSKGLFKRAIMQSGSALAPWCTGDPNNGISSAKALGFEGNDEVAMLRLLQNATNNQLFTATLGAHMLVPIYVQSRLGPVIEKKSKHAFISEHPRDILRKGDFNRDVELMFGMLTAEGMIFDILYLMKNGEYTPLPAENYIPYFLNLTKTQKQDVTEKIKAFYNLNTPNPNGHIALITDTYFTSTLYDSVFGHLTHNQKIYVYLIASDSAMNTLKRSNPITENYYGVSHVEDLYNLYMQATTAQSAFVEGTLEYTIIKDFVKLKTNFVKHGQPTGNRGQDRRQHCVQWKLVQNTGFVDYLRVDLDENTADVDFYKERVKFWSDIYKEYNYESFYPASW